jgi:hypothetical protein
MLASKLCIFRKGFLSKLANWLPLSESIIILDGGLRRHTAIKKALIKRYCMRDYIDQPIVRRNRGRQVY